MRVYFRGFNRKINSKSGARLPEGQYRGTPEWLEFERALIDCVNELGHDISGDVEHPHTMFLPPDIDKSIIVHHTKREFPTGSLFWMQMHMKDLFTLDTNGWGADHSEIKEAKSFFPHEDEIDSMQFCERLSDEMLATGQSKCVQDESTDTTPSNFILVPVQIPRDYTIKWHSPITVKYFVDSVQSWAVENRYHVCFKMHPHNTHDADLHKSVDDAVAGSSYVHKVKGNIHELIKRSAGLFVINSGTGFEALIHGKPVATFGDCDYNHVSFNADLRRLDEARTFIYSYKEEFRRVAYKFVHWYLHRHGYWLRDSGYKSRLLSYLRSVLQ
jgi:hypothetical protein